MQRAVSKDRSSSDPAIPGGHAWRDNSSTRVLIALRPVAVAVMILAFAVSSRAASKEIILHSFQSNRDGTNPQSEGVIADAKGNLYGVTMDGGEDGLGAVYELRPQQNGSWTEALLYSFLNNGGDGFAPTSSLVLDAQGNLYGMTRQGGSANDGTVYELTPTSNGAWKETILHDFNCNTAGDGCLPDAFLIFDQAGNLYGETIAGACPQGAGTGCGVVFKLSPDGGSWNESILHQFASGFDNKKEGSNPGGGLVWDKAGNLYGVCSSGGLWTWGNVWQLSPLKNGQWKETILWEFGPDVDNPPKGGGPNSPLVWDKAGNLYGTTGYGGNGPGGGGVVYQLSPGAHGKWSETVVHAFSLNKTDSDGMYVNSVAVDAAGRLYGTALAGGGIGEPGCSAWYMGCGVVFELTPGSNGKWKETILHRFNNDSGPGDGGQPWPDRLLLDSTGNIYGTTQYGGDANNGTVFEIKP
jgi:uncharacterized repeat protein (TIGR03803 family)